MLLNDKIRITPFARILPPLAAGIACQRFASAPLWAVALIAAAVYAGAWLTRKIPAGRAYVYASLFCTGLLLADLSSTKRPMPRNERLAMIVEIDRTPSLSGRWAVTTARAGMYRCFGRQAGTTPARWQPTDEKIELRFDTGFHVSVGEQMAVAGYLNPIDTSGSRYGALMRSRGLTAPGLRHPRKPVARMDGNGRTAMRSARAVPTGGGRAAVTASSVGNRPEHGLRAGRWRKTHHGPGPAGRLCPHGHGAHTGRIGPAHGIRDAARQSGARLGRTAAARPSDPERSGDPRAMDLCRYGRTVAVGRPLGPDAVGRASGARCLGQRQRLQRRARHGNADAGRPAELSVRRKLSTLVRRRAVDPVFLSPPLPQASEPAPGARRAVQFAAARRGGPDRHAAP